MINVLFLWGPGKNRMLFNAQAVAKNGYLGNCCVKDKADLDLMT